MAPSRVTVPANNLSESVFAVLLCTKNGARFLPQQLRSIAAQTCTNWHLYVSDDGSDDSTKSIIVQFAKDFPSRVSLRDGPRSGFCNNFLSLALDSSIRADYYAYCDQDDVWYPDKIQRAIKWLSEMRDVPALYASRVEIIDYAGTHVGYSRMFRRQPAFKNALVQNIAGGNTMVFNSKSKRLLEAAGHVDVIAHDWWTYQLTSAAGGRVMYDPKPSVQYRQHGHNLIGSNLGWYSAFQRLRMLLANRFRHWNDLNIAALDECEQLINSEERKVLELLRLARAQRDVANRVRYLRKSGVYRQTALENIGLITAAILGKL